MKRGAAVAFAAVLLASSAARAQDEPGAPGADATSDEQPKEAPAPRKRPVFLDVEGGYGAERMTGLELRRYDIGFRIRIGSKSGAGWELPLEARFQPGVTENGLTSYRTEMGLGIGNAGRLRVTGGGHLVYTMVLRTSERDAFRKALFGNIGAFGIGVHASVTADLIEPDPVGILLGVRGIAEVLDGGSAYGGVVFLGATFAARSDTRK